MGNSSGMGTGLVLIGVFLVWFVYHFWWLILGIGGIVIAVYYLMNYYDKKKIKEEEEKRKQIRIREAKRREEERIKVEQERIKSRLELFSFTDKEAEILFGKLWRKRLAKPEKQFIEQEISRIATKLEEDTSSFMPKIFDFAEKVFDMIDYYVQILGKEKGWDEIDYENWKEDWDDVRRIWNETKHQYKKKSRKSKKPNPDASNYYKILGIPSDYTIKEIKVHYRKLMLKYHPDRNNSKYAEAKCKKINEAYEVLSDPEKKKSYDQYGFIFE